MPDHDLTGLSRVGLENQVMAWRAEARYIFAQRSDDVCWLDFYRRLAGLLPERPDWRQCVPLDKPQMLANCDHYLDCLLSGREEQYRTPPSREEVVQENTRLLAEVTALKARVAELEDLEEWIEDKRLDSSYPERNDD